MKVRAILDSIEMGNMALPEFQRGSVWGRDQVRGLMQSLYRSYPVGSLLTWKTMASSAAVRGDSIDDGKVIDLLLDGQQRITSLYGIMRGHEPKFFQGDAKAFTDLYFDLRTEVFEFYGPVKMKDDPLWVNVTELYKTGLGPWFGAASQMQLDAETQGRYLERLNRVTSIADIDFHVEQITGDKDVDEVVEIFNRVNSGGTKLSKGDLALATLCGQWPDARNEIRRMISKWDEAGYHFDIDWLLRAATAIATYQAPFSTLRRVSPAEFRDALIAAEKAIDFLLNLISSRLGLDHDRVLGGRYSLTALARLVHDAGGQITDPVQQGKVLYWYVHALMWGRYSGSTETRLARDLEAMRSGGIDGMIEEMDRWRGSLTVRPSDFDGATVGARFYVMIYLLTRIGRSRDLVSGLELSAAMLGAGNRLELHHIFPKKRLRDAGYEYSDVNAIANFCFLTGDGNRKISAKNPADYLAAVAAERPGALESQWIPVDPDLWQIDRYRDFLRARREMLALAANDFLDELLRGTTHQVSVRDSGSSIDPELIEVVALCGELGLSAPYLNHEVVDEESGEVLVIADAVWPAGAQSGLSQPLALLLESDESMEERLGELGFRFFVDRQRLTWYFEELTGVDIDGDGVVGEAEVTHG